MRIWSIHPSHLDTKGLLAAWREGLLALHVLRGQTKGYRNHPQLLRFKNHPTPVLAISAYLHAIVDEAEARNYAFKRDKLEIYTPVEPLTVTSGQIEFETHHLQQKLKTRDAQRYLRCAEVTALTAHPLFTVVAGEVERWEKL